VDDYIVDSVAVRVAALNSASASLPDLNRAILRACDHPFALAVERNARDITRVAIEGEEGVWVRGLDVVELDCVVACSGEETLVWRDAEAIDLRIRVLDCARADTRQSLPEPNGVIVTSCA